MCKPIKKLSPKLGNVKNKYKNVSKPRPKIITGKITGIHNKVTNIALSRGVDKLGNNENKQGINNITSGKITSNDTTKSPIKKTPIKSNMKGKKTQ